MAKMFVQFNEHQMLKCGIYNRQQRSGGNIFPPTLNILSTGAEDTGATRYFIANVDRQGKEIISLLVYSMFKQLTI